VSTGTVVMLLDFADEEGELRLTVGDLLVLVQM
jgi:hypothetical protein